MPWEERPFSLLPDRDRHFVGGDPPANQRTTFRYPATPGLDKAFPRSWKPRRSCPRRASLRMTIQKSARLPACEDLHRLSTKRFANLILKRECTLPPKQEDRKQCSIMDAYES